MDSYFTPTIRHGRTTVTIQVDTCDKEFIVPRKALREKSGYFKLFFNKSWHRSQARLPAEMPLIPGVITPTILSMFLRWVFTEKIEYDGDPEGENIPMTERLTILISLARFASTIVCPTMADPIEEKIRFIMMGIATPFLDVSASQADSDNSMETEEADDDDDRETEEADDDDGWETEEVDDDDESSNDSSESEVVDPDHQGDPLDTGFVFGDSNTTYLVSEHIIQAVKLPASNQVRLTIIDSCLREYFSRRPFRFIGLIGSCPEFARDFVQRVAMVLAETMSYGDGNVLFWDPVTEMTLPMYQADTTGSRWWRARHPHKPSRNWRWA
ncbi:hypothetical protein N7528_002847 [Penicillium herquei]|nr:hypothetical protein N7528_002847 [Penicillium herquei]